MTFCSHTPPLTLSLTLCRIIEPTSPEQEKKIIITNTMFIPFERRGNVYSKADIMREAAAQGLVISWWKIAAFVVCVLLQVAGGKPLPQAVRD
jgi:hypothetical protein